MATTKLTLKAGDVLTATVNEGRAHVRSSDGIDSAFTRSSVSFGPYLVDRIFLSDGDATLTTATYTTALNAYVYPNAGAPVSAARASLTVNPTGDDNALTFTARAYGAEGNSISIVYVDPGGTTATLAVSVFRQAITVSLGRAASAINSTAAAVKAAIEAHAIANQLVTVAIYAADSGSADDGTGLVTAMSVAALSGGAGTAIGQVAPAGLLIDTTNGVAYQNIGTQAVPVWRRMGRNVVQALTASGAVTAGVSVVNLNHATVAVEATIANAAAHAGFFAVVDTSASGTAAHTLTLTSGTFNGTATVATLNAPGESLLVFFDENGAGTIIVNTGAVGLS